MSAVNEVSAALLAHAGIDSTDVTSVVYRHEVGELPKLDVTFLVVSGDPVEFSTETRTFEWREVER